MNVGDRVRRKPEYRTTLGDITGVISRIFMRQRQGRGIINIEGYRGTTFYPETFDVVDSQEETYIRVFIQKSDGKTTSAGTKFGSVQGALTGVDAITRERWDVYAVPLRAVAKLREDGTIEEFN